QEREASGYGGGETSRPSTRMLGDPANWRRLASSRSATSITVTRGATFKALAAVPTKSMAASSYGQSLVTKISTSTEIGTARRGHSDLDRHRTVTTVAWWPC